MTNYGPSSAFVLVGGKNVSADIWNLDDSIEQKNTQSNGLGSSWQEFKSTGLAGVKLETTGGFYSDETTGLCAAIQALGATRQLFSYGVAGMSLGADCRLMDGVFAGQFKRIAQREDLTKANAIWTCSGKPYDGRIIYPIQTAVTADGNSQSSSVDRLDDSSLVPVAITSSSVANPTVITAPAHGLITGDVIYISGHTSVTPDINGERVVTVTGVDTFTIPVNVSDGGTGGSFKKLTQTNGVADIHVPALTLGGHTGLIVKLRHSDDDSSYSDLATFTTATTAGVAYRATITGQIKRYVAASWDFADAGSPSAQFFVAISNT